MVFMFGGMMECGMLLTGSFDKKGKKSLKISFSSGFLQRVGTNRATTGQTSTDAMQRALSPSRWTTDRLEAIESGEEDTIHAQV